MTKSQKAKATRRDLDRLEDKFRVQHFELDRTQVCKIGWEVKVDTMTAHSTETEPMCDFARHLLELQKSAPKSRRRNR